MNKKKIIGDSGEEFVAGRLQDWGFAIAERNYRSRYGEIDIIAENGQLILFVEVKLRSSGAIAAPREFVDRRKRQRIIATAGCYISQTETKLQPRFDVAEVYATENGYKLNYIPDAFDAEGN